MYETPKDWTDEQRTEELRKAGCTCSSPLHGWRPRVGPRCRLCNTVADLNRFDVV